MHLRLGCSKHCTTRLNSIVERDWIMYAACLSKFFTIELCRYWILHSWRCCSIELSNQEYLHTLDYSTAALIIAWMWIRVQTLYNWFGDSCTNDLQWFLCVVQYASTNVVCTACFRHDGRSDTSDFGTQLMHKYFTKTLLIRLCEQARFGRFRCWNQCVYVQPFGCLLCLNGCLAVDNFASI